MAFAFLASTPCSHFSSRFDGPSSLPVHVFHHLGVWAYINACAQLSAMWISTYLKRERERNIYQASISIAAIYDLLRAWVEKRKRERKRRRPAGTAPNERDTHKAFLLCLSPFSISSTGSSHPRDQRTGITKIPVFFLGGRREREGYGRHHYWHLARFPCLPFRYCLSSRHR